MAEFPLAKKLAEEALATKTKDLQLAAWLTEAQLHIENFAGLQQGLNLCTGLVRDFWDTVYPPVEAGDMELRSGPLDFLGSGLDLALKSCRLMEARSDL